MKKAGSQLDVRSLRWQWWQRTLVECCACPVFWCFEDRNLGSERRKDGEPEMKCRPPSVCHRFFFRYFQKALAQEGGHQTCSPPFFGDADDLWNLQSPWYLHPWGPESWLEVPVPLLLEPQGPGIWAPGQLVSTNWIQPWEIPSGTGSVGCVHWNPGFDGRSKNW